MYIYEGRNQVTSPRGYRTLNGVYGWHPGIDVVGLDSKKIRMPSYSGTVTTASTGTKEGNYVVVQLEPPRSDTKFYIFHLTSRNVIKGQKVKEGNILGIEGNTGNSFGSHCHFEVRVNGANVDPTPYCGIPNAKGIYTETKKEESNGGDEVMKMSTKPVRMQLGPMSGGDLDTIKKMLDSLQIAYNEESGYIKTADVSPGDQNTILQKVVALGIGFEPLVTAITDGIPQADYDAMRIRAETAEKKQGEYLQCIEKVKEAVF